MQKLFLLSMFLISCAGVQERMALRKCTFVLYGVRVYDFKYDRMQLDFIIEAKNPNQVDAVLDKLTGTLYVNGVDIFSGSTGEQVRISAGKSTTFSTNTTIEYIKVGTALIEAMQFEKAQYEFKAQAHISTLLGELTYPVTIHFPQE